MYICAPHITLVPNEVKIPGTAYRDVMSHCVGAENSIYLFMSYSLLQWWQVLVPDPESSLQPLLLLFKIYLLSIISAAYRHWAWVCGYPLEYSQSTMNHASKEKGFSRSW